MRSKCYTAPRKTWSLTIVKRGKRRILTVELVDATREASRCYRTPSTSWQSVQGPLTAPGKAFSSFMASSSPPLSSSSSPLIPPLSSSSSSSSVASFQLYSLPSPLPFRPSYQNIYEKLSQCNRFLQKVTQVRRDGDGKATKTAR